MLQTMRKNTKIILWVTVISFVLLIFLVWGADLRMGSGSSNPNTIGIVNGEPISTAEFQRVYQQNRQSASAQGRDLEPSELVAIEERTWNDLVDNSLLLKEAKRLHLEAKDSEVRSVMLNHPPAYFQRAFVDSLGQFDFQRYRQYILSPATPERDLVAMEQYIRANLPMQKLQQLIVSGASVPEEEVRQTFMDINEEVEVAYVMMPAPAIDEVPTDEAIRAYFESTQEEYKVPHRADVLYITIPRVATPADTSALVTELEEFADEARKSQGGSDQDAALRYSDFETLAMTFSDGPNADNGGLSVGFLAPQEMTASIADAVQGLAVGEISAPFQDADMIHIVQVVDEKTDESGARLVQLRDLARRISPSDSTLQAMREQVDAVRAKAVSSGLGAAAAEAGIPVQRVENVTESGFIPGLSLVPGIGTWINSHEAGDVSRVYASSDGWHLIEVAEVKEAGPADFETVQGRVRNALVTEQRLLAVKNQAEQLMATVTSGQSLEEAADKAGLVLQHSPSFTRQSGMPGIPQNPDVVAAAFAGALGEVLGPIKTNRGWVIIQVEARPPVDEALYQTQAPQIRNTLMGQQQITVFNAYLEDLRKRAKIEDHRS